MGGFNTIRGDETIVFADNASFDGTERGGKMTADGQLWIGATASPHVRAANLTSGTGIVITNSAGGISIATNGAVVPNTITGDSGGPLSPSAGNWNILGQQAGTIAVMDTVGSGNTLKIEDRTWTTSLIVDPSATIGLRGTYTTITLALAAASSGQTIFIRPGTYTENITMVAGVNLQGYEASGDSFGTIISGNIACSYTGSCSISGLGLRNTNADIVSVTGASATLLTITNCRIFQNASAGSQYFLTCSAGSAEVKVSNCLGNLGTNGAYVNCSAGTLIQFDDCYFRNDGSSGVANSVTGGVTVFFANSTIISKFIVTTSAILNLRYCRILDPTSSGIALVLTGAKCNAWYTVFAGDTAATVITIDATSTFEGIHTTLDVDANVANTIMTNAGTLTYDIISQRDNAAGPGKGIVPAPTTAAFTNYGTARFRQGQLVNVTTPGAYPYTTLDTDYLILVDTASARTITPYASPVAGQTYRIKDNVGSAATNNITITPSGKNIDGAASSTINVNYGAVDIIYNGTQWNVL